MKPIGKQEPYTAISTSSSSAITVRGRDLCSELIGHVSFTHYYFLLLTGRQPTADQSFFLDAVLVTAAEHGLSFAAQAARMTYDADPAALQGAVAAGILGAGPVVLGTAEVCGQFLTQIVQGSSGQAESLDQSAERLVSEWKAAGRKIPGFGHHLHSDGDPRTDRLLGLATERGVAGPHVAALRAAESAINKAFAKSLVANASGALAAVLLDVDFPLAALKGIPILARTAGILAHLHEESANPIGFLMAHHGKRAIHYRPSLGQS